MTDGLGAAGGPGGPGGPETPGAPGELAAGGLGPAGQLAGTGWRVQGRRVAAAALLAAAVIAWAATPVSGGGAGTRLLLIAAVACAVASTGRLAIGDESDPTGPFDPIYLRAWAQVADVLRGLPWAEGLIIAVLVLEARHGARPWHTAVLGIALLAYVIAAHLAQARTPPAALAGQLPVIAAGVGLLALAVGAAALPRLHAGPATELLRVLAVLAAVAAGALALPVGGRRRPPGAGRDPVSREGQP
jgi:hypothetical protein